MTAPATQTSVDAISLGLSFGELSLSAFVSDPDRYQLARANASRILSKFGIEMSASAEPADPTELDSHLLALSEKVVVLLAQEKGTDPYAGAFFLIAKEATVMLTTATAGTADRRRDKIVEGWLREIGVDNSPLVDLERYAGLLRGVLFTTPLSPAAQTALFSSAAGNYMWAVVRAFDASGQLANPIASILGSMQEMSAQLDRVEGEVAGVHQEVRESRYDIRALYTVMSERFEALVKDGDARIERLLEQIAEQMTGSGAVDPAVARTETFGKPKTLFERISRWQARSKPIGAFEAALWAALDVIPGGTGIKLGLALLKAVLTSGA